MRRLSGFVAVFGCVASFLLVGCAANGGTASAFGSVAGGPTGDGWIHAGSLVYHAPAYMPTRSQRPAVLPNFLIPYKGGAVLAAPKAYFIFWGYKTYGDPDKVAQLLESYCTVMGGSRHNNIYTQYYEVVDSKTISITNPENQCGGFYYDEKDAVPEQPTDAQVAHEALLGAQKFGYDPNGSYVVATPNGRSTVGFGTQWCAYHSASYASGKLVAYTNLPYIPNSGSACGANFIKPPKDESGVDEGVTIIEGAEYGTSVTDPNPGASWYSLQYGEIGCPWQGVKNERFRNKFYTTGPMYSDASQSCVQSYK